MAKEKEELLTVDLLHELLRYVDGVLVWKQPRPGVTVGAPAGTKGNNGYITIQIKYKHYFAHRLIYMMHYGQFPEFIDHVDGNTENNQIRNLRPATRVLNARNAKLKSTNKSGVKGVHWQKSCNRWCAQVRANGKINTVGFFTDLDDARIAVRAAREKYHGEFTNHG